MPRRPLALAVLLGACAGPPPPLAIDARFDGAKALILGIAEADATRWYGIDLESGAGIEDVPPIVVRDAERITLYANVSTEPSARILSRPGLLDTSQLDVGQPLPPGLMSFERELSMSSTGSWVPRATPPAVRSPNFLSPSECPKFTVGPAVELVGATEPVSAAARLPNGQVLLFTGRTFEGDPGAPYQLGSWNYTLATRRVVETQPMSLSAMKAEKLRVAAAIPVGDELILGAQRPAGQGELWRGRLGGQLTKWIDAPGGIPIIDAVGLPDAASPSALLIENRAGGAFVVELSGGAWTRVLDDRRPAACSLQSSNVSSTFDHYFLCGGVRAGARGEPIFLLQPPGDQAFAIDPSTRRPTPLSVPAGHHLLRPVQTPGGLFTMNSSDGGLIFSVFQLQGSTFAQVEDLPTQQPTSLFAFGDFVVFGGALGTLSAWSLASGNCPGPSNALAGLVPDQIVEIGLNDWLATGSTKNGPVIVVPIHLERL